MNLQVVITVFVALVSCTRFSSPTVQIPVTASPTSVSKPLTSTPPVVATSTASLSHADVTITPEQYHQVVQVSVSQIVALIPPSIDNEWELGYDPNLFDLLTPPDKIRAPGSSGWLLRAKNKGESEVSITSVAQCPPGVICPLAIARFDISIQVR